MFEGIRYLFCYFSPDYLVSFCLFFKPSADRMAQKGGRQQPGFACEECRRRKARCDRVRPTCGPCLETGRICVTRYKNSQKGPKTTGQLNAMRLQIGISSPLISLLMCLSQSDHVHRTPHSDFYFVHTMHALPLFENLILTTV